MGSEMTFEQRCQLAANPGPDCEAILFGSEQEIIYSTATRLGIVLGIAAIVLALAYFLIKRRSKK